MSAPPQLPPFPPLSRCPGARFARAALNHARMHSPAAAAEIKGAAPDEKKDEPAPLDM